MHKKELRSHYIYVIAFAILLGVGIFQYSRIQKVNSELTLVTERLQAVDARLASTTIALNQFNASTSEALKRQASGLAYVENKVGVYRQEAATVSSAVSTLKKLSETDPQLLAKYSKVFFLNENYDPARLTAVPEDYKYSSTKAVSIHSEVWPHLKTLIDDAKKSGVKLYVSSGYRSFAEQKNLKSDYRVVYGAGTANSFSADQGYSEHQLATALDFTTEGLEGALDGFDKTSAYAWLLTNAYKYGFVLSYPPDNQYYQFEPWHWRYVGIKLAGDLRTQGKYFYDLDQRKIDEYLVNLFD